MWVFLNDAWLSIVEDREDEEQLLVRSRRSGDVARTFGVEEFQDLKADYWYRAHIPRDQVAGAIAREVLRIDYPNFKNSVKDDTLHAAYSKVWTVGFNLQANESIKGKQRRRLGAIIPLNSIEDDVWPPLNCESCGDPLDHSFHAPVIGQEPGTCETCWNKGLYGNIENTEERETDEAVCPRCEFPLSRCHCRWGGVNLNKLRY